MPGQCLFGENTHIFFHKVLLVLRETGKHFITTFGSHSKKQKHQQTAKKKVKNVALNRPLVYSLGAKTRKQRGPCSTSAGNVYVR